LPCPTYKQDQEHVYLHNQEAASLILPLPEYREEIRSTHLTISSFIHLKLQLTKLSI
jgi:hypothetical protein